MRPPIASADLLGLLGALVREAQPNRRAIDALLAEIARLSPSDRKVARERQLARVLAFAQAECAFYEARLARFRAGGPGGALDLAAFAEVPLLTRADLQRPTLPLEARRVFSGYESLGSVSTSGSTGVPIRTERTRALGLLQERIRQRWHELDGRDFDASCAFVNEPHPPGRADPPEGRSGPSWALDRGRGASFFLDLRADPRAQLDWVGRKKPKYLVTFPSNLAELLRVAEEEGRPPCGLEEVLLSSEPVSDELRERTRRVFGARVRTTYSASEIGAIAFERPDRPGYRVEESVHLEVLDDDGAPTKPGEIGRIVVTTLFDLRRPLVRYDIGDYGEVAENEDGELEIVRVHGRARTMIRRADGTRVWPYFELDRVTGRGSVARWQIVQHRDLGLTARIVRGAGYSNDAEAAVKEALERALGPLPITFEYVTSIERSARGKYFEVVSELDPPDAGIALGAPRSDQSSEIPFEAGEA